MIPIQIHQTNTLLLLRPVHDAGRQHAAEDAQQKSPDGAVQQARRAGNEKANNPRIIIPNTMPIKNLARIILIFMWYSFNAGGVNYDINTVTVPELERQRK